MRAVAREALGAAPAAERARDRVVGARGADLSITRSAGERDALRAELRAGALRDGTHPSVLLAPADAAEIVASSCAARVERHPGECAARREAMQSQSGEELLDPARPRRQEPRVLNASGARTACDVSQEKLALALDAGAFSSRTQSSSS
jgi:hypothetical protein